MYSETKKGADEQYSVTSSDLLNTEDEAVLRKNRENTGPVALLSVDLSELQLHEVYQWVDQVPTDRVKKNIHRDFSDCSLIAKIIEHHLPAGSKSQIQVINYPQTSAKKEKVDNWDLLNKRVLLKF
jgi:hypothetical protein